MLQRESNNSCNYAIHQYINPMYVIDCRIKSSSHKLCNISTHQLKAVGGIFRGAHRITEGFELKGPPKPTLTAMRIIFNKISLLRTQTNLALNVSIHEATASLGTLYQCFTTLILKSFLLISTMNIVQLKLV